jgi:ubiquitin C-terminal hydrolase
MRPRHALETDELDTNDDTPVAQNVYKVIPEYLFYDQQLVPTCNGFNNIGSICWFNSLLQMLLSTSPINTALLNAERNMRSNPLAVAYISLLKAYQAKQPISPTTSANLLQIFINRLRDRGLPPLTTGQECADEGYLLFLDALNCPEVYNVCRNIYEYTIKCDCGAISSQHRDNAYRLQVHMTVPAKTGEEFARWIHSHCSEVDTFYCQACKKQYKNVYRAEVAKMLREVIVCTFNKFQIKTKAFFPTTLEFPSMGKTLRYRLVAQVEHSGTQRSGHYWAKIVRDGSTYLANDSSVSTTELVPAPETYMIAYVLIDRS